MQYMKKIWRFCWPFFCERLWSSKGVEAALVWKPSRFGVKGKRTIIVLSVLSVMSATPVMSILSLCFMFFPCELEYPISYLMVWYVDNMCSYTINKIYSVSHFLWGQWRFDCFDCLDAQDAVDLSRLAVVPYRPIGVFGGFSGILAEEHVRTREIVEMFLGSFHEDLRSWECRDCREKRHEANAANVGHWSLLRSSISVGHRFRLLDPSTEQKNKRNKRNKP